MPLIGLLENNMGEERISELEGMTIETFTIEKLREQEWKKNKNKKQYTGTVGLQKNPP